ncbi:UNVERIFIED_CONTAM: hypothetical protein FKN15_060106 [Acipenser sinensis]
MPYSLEIAESPQESAVSSVSPPTSFPNTSPVVSQTPIIAATPVPTITPNVPPVQAAAPMIPVVPSAQPVIKRSQGLALEMGCGSHLGSKEHIEEYRIH